MSVDLDRSFEALQGNLNREHEGRRAELLARLEAAPPRALGAPAMAAGFGRRWAAILAFAAGLSCGPLVVWLAGGDLAWAANDGFDFSARATRVEAGPGPKARLVHMESRFSEAVEENGKRTWTTIAQPRLTVVEGQRAAIVIKDAQREIGAEVIFAAGAGEGLAVVSIKDAQGAIVWAKALAVPVEKPQED